MPRRLVAIAAAACAAPATACEGEITTARTGYGAVLAPAESLAVGDSMQLRAGILYSDGRFVRFDSAEFTSPNPTAAVRRHSGWMVGQAVGPARIVVTVILPTRLEYDSTFRVVPE